MDIETVDFRGWRHSLKLTNAAAELIVTTDVGPRIISYTVPGCGNVLKIDEPEAGQSGEPDFRGRGGHRLWVAPEDDRTYAPDNSPVPHETLGPGSIRLVNPATDPWRVEKELTVTLEPGCSTVSLQHRITNRGTKPTRLASWALSVMRAGGLEIIPQPPMGEHPRDLLPNRLIVPWSYTDFTDPRWRLGRDFITLRQIPGAPPAKVGLLHREKWVAYALPDALFLKTFAYEEDATYPDYGCNFETFTNGGMLEIESLSPLRTLAPGESVGHGEKWHLFPAADLPPATDDATLTAWIAPYLAAAGLV
jgi:hypothetical protein